jgi:phage-related minor tail protein
VRNPTYIRSDARDVEEQARLDGSKAIETIARLIADLTGSIEELEKRVKFLERTIGR